MRFGPCDGVSAVGGGVRKAGFKGGCRVELSFSGFCKEAACVNLGVTVKGLRGVENAAVAVEESFLFDVKWGYTGQNVFRSRQLPWVVAFRSISG